MAEPFLGEIHMFAGSYAPRGYAECMGQLVSTTQNEALFSLLGTRYGGDGMTTFGLPDFRGRLPVHAGVGPNTSIEWKLGSKGGLEMVTLSPAQLPPHTHAVMVSTDRGVASSPQDAVFSQLDTTAKETLYIPPDQTPPMTTMRETALSPVGESMGHPNLMPFLTIRFAIAMAGTYPPQS